jgi:hypothetical protein
MSNQPMTREQRHTAKAQVIATMNQGQSRPRSSHQGWSAGQPCDGLSMQRPLQPSSSGLRIERYETLISIKHLHLSIDFRITIADMPPEDDGLNPPDPLNHAHQTRLLAAVKNHPQMLTRWMHDLIVGEMHAHGWYD